MIVRCVRATTLLLVILLSLSDTLWGQSESDDIIRKKGLDQQEHPVLPTAVDPPGTNSTLDFDGFLAAERDRLARRDQGVRRVSDRRPPSGYQVASKAAAPTLIVVNSAYDDSDTNNGAGDCSTGWIIPPGGQHECTLRAAIQTANLVAGTDPVLIDFEIVTAPSGTYDATNDVWTIPVGTAVRGPSNGALPQITRGNVHINGETQPPAPTFDPAQCGQLWNGVPHNLKVVVDGSNLSGNSDNGLVFSSTADTSGVRGLVVSNFPSRGLQSEAQRVTMECLYVGTDYSGMTSQPNLDVGVFVADTGSVVRNSLVSGNGDGSIGSDGYGIVTYRTVEAVIEGNLIGVDATGANALANRAVGILLRMGDYNRIGGPAPEHLNVVSGNSAGVWDSASYHIVIEGNRIGTNRAGDAALPNTWDGIVGGGFWGRIGGPGPGAGNLVSGNTDDGIWVAGWWTTIQGNKIGTNLAGNLALPNGGDGIEEHSYARETLIGGLDPGAGNLVSGNGANGLYLEGQYTIVEGNLIGTDADGLLAVGNQEDGVHVATDSARIGNVDPGGRNIISGNGDDGVELADTSNVVLGNYIGTDITGTTKIPNQWGVYVAAKRNSVGVVHPTGGNVISGNALYGILVRSLSGPVVQGTTIFANRIGTDAAGTAKIPNDLHGINDWGIGTIIGAPGEHGLNVISGNGEAGIHVASGASFTEIVGNLIGTDATGLAALGNTKDGIEVLGQHVYIGGAAGTPDANVISGNASNGIKIDGSSSYCEVFGNLIGVDRGGNFAIGNSTGMDVRGDNCTIGGPGLGNVIGGQSLFGIFVSQTASSLDIMGNLIGTDATGNLAIPNATGIFTEGTDVAIGGVDIHLRNVISGNTSDGIRLGGLAQNTSIINNHIGTTIAGAGPRPNGWNGISGGGDAAVIGGDGPGTGNLIAYNTLHGIHLDTTPSLVSVLRNSIHSNGQLGINLFGGNENADDVTANDTDDPDTGPNALQNYPVIQTPVTNTGAVTTPITVDLNSVPSTTFRIEAFVSTMLDPSGYGEGQIFIGSTTVTTDANGDASFSDTLPISVAPIGSWITMTATRLVSSVYKETSEFSAAAQIEGPQIGFTGKVFLGGAYSGGGMTTPPAFHNVLPTIQPYSHPIFDGTEVEYDGTEIATSIGSDIIDWVKVELRDPPSPSIPVATRAAFVRDDGQLVDLDGSTPLPIYGVSTGHYYVVVCHRNHVCAMSTLVDFSSGFGSFDFTANTGWTTGPPPQMLVDPGTYALWPGNGVPDWTVQALDFDRFLRRYSAGAGGYQLADFNMDGVVDASDIGPYIDSTTDGAHTQVP